MNDITFITPYRNILNINIRCLSSYLKKYRFSTKIIFLPSAISGDYDESVAKKIADISKDSRFIGISLMTNFFGKIISLTNNLRKYTNKPIIWGGIHPTIEPEECMQYADIVCIGEGEKSLLELLTKSKKHRNYTDVKGMWFKKNGKIIKNELREPILNLDSIPHPDYDFRNQYILHKNKILRLNNQLFDNYSEQVYETITARYCPFNCSFCCNKFLKSKFKNCNILRKRSVEDVISELEEAKKSFNVKMMRLIDDSFFSLDIGYIRKFCEEYKKRIGIPFRVTGLNPLLFNREKIGMLIDAGLNELRMGIQSGSPRIRKMYSRFYTNKQVLEIAKELSSFRQIKQIQYDMIVENPWETEDDVIQSIKLASELPRPMVLYFFSLTFYPGTELYDRAIEEGIIKDKIKEVYNKGYHHIKNDYFMALFHLVWNFKLPNFLINFLTNKKVIHSPFFYPAKSLLTISIPLFEQYNLLSRGFRSLFSGNLYRIPVYFKRKLFFGKGKSIREA